MLAALCVAGAVATFVPATLPHNSTPISPPEAAATTGGPLATYVSTSGISHYDVANVRWLRKGEGWDPGDPNAINDSWRTAIDTVWDQIASENPDGVFATGDMVQGFWGVDDDHTGIFGPVNSFRHREQAIRNAGNAYYGTLKREFRKHGLTVYPGMGDHEMGGLDTDGETAPHTFRAKAFPAWVSTWEDNFGHRAYYHVKLAGGVELWTLKPFRRDPDGGVSATVSKAQLRWLRKSLDSSHARWRIVQTELPPYASPGFHGSHTSQTTIHNADRVYDIMANHGVDLVLDAEFHDVDALQRQGLPEIIHGGAVAGGTANYLTIDVFRDHLGITLTRMPNGTLDSTEQLWAPSDRNRAPKHIYMPPGGSVAGHMIVTHDGALTADGDLTLH